MFSNQLIDRGAFFIVGCGRSGTTSICRILGTAENGVCLSEPNPNLNVETRLMMDGRYSRPAELLTETVLRRVDEHSGQGLVYGEKSITLGPFIRHLADMIPCKFVFIKRDGRDVVRSLIDWNDRMFGSIYRECRESGELSARAKQAVGSLPLEYDTSDYSRPRPAPTDQWYDAWEKMSRGEMCAWYWSRINELYLDQLETLPGERWTSIDYSSVTTAEILRVAEFVGLRGLSEEAVQTMLRARINSLRDRTGEDDEFPRWPNWTEGALAQFDRIAGSTMKRLGYDAAAKLDVSSGSWTYMPAANTRDVLGVAQPPVSPELHPKRHDQRLTPSPGFYLKVLLHRAGLQRYRPYGVGSLRETREAVETRCRSVAEHYERQNLNNPFDLYRRLIDALTANSRVCVRPMRELALEVPAGRVVVGLRHDVDADIRTGLRAARHLARVGLPGSFYLLHTAHYYGAVRERVFERSTALDAFLNDFVISGCEIGLHCDALHLYLHHRIDGATALQEEIAWLRHQGCRIHGTAAHNSAPAYGAENFEIFKGRAFQDRQSLLRDGNRIPLQVLDEADLQLSYEANFPTPPRKLAGSAVASYIAGAPPDAVRQKEWLWTYLVDNPLFDRGYDTSIWLLGKNAWAIAQHSRDRSLTWPVPVEAVIEYLETTPAGSRIVVTIHPEYIGLD